MQLQDIGILPAKVKQFNKKNIFTVKDLINFIPRKYYDFTKETGFLDKDQISCLVINVVDVKMYDNKTNLIIVSGKEKNTNKNVKVMYFQQKYMFAKLYATIGHDVYVCGKAVYNDEYHNYSITAPLVFSTHIEQSKVMQPVYSSIKGMSAEYLTSRIKDALMYREFYEEMLPPEIVIKEQLMPYEEAIMELHIPSCPEKLYKAQQRMLFNDLLYFSGKLEMQNRRIPRGNAHNIVSLKLFNDVKNALPYQLSEGQNKVINDILADMKEGKNVRALLSSDVGSGKTTVALLLSCAFAGKTNNFEGYQVAWLVPSKTLAMQHTEELKSYLWNEKKRT